MCHCFECQRRTGSTFGVQAFYPREQVRLAKGIAKRYARRADSGRTVTFSFCPECGGTVFWEPEQRKLRDTLSAARFSWPTIAQSRKNRENSLSARLYGASHRVFARSERILHPTRICRPVLVLSPLSPNVQFVAQRLRLSKDAVFSPRPSYGASQIQDQRTSLQLLRSARGVARVPRKPFPHILDKS